jgi:paraquat-inducible protein A
MHTESRKQALVACHECDALYRAPSSSIGALVRCQRCGATLYRDLGPEVSRPLAYICAAGILFLIANLSPIMGLEFEGVYNASTLIGAVHALYDQDMRLLGLLVLLTTCVIPALNLLAMLYILLPLHFSYRPPGFTGVLRVIQQLKPWGMVEVFLLGVLVALVKLTHMATVVPGTALWAYAGVMLLLTLAAASLDPQTLWEHA